MYYSDTSGVLPSLLPELRSITPSVFVSTQWFVAPPNSLGWTRLPQFMMAVLLYNVFFNGLREKNTGKPLSFNGKIYGFRLRFSLTPIHCVLSHPHWKSRWKHPESPSPRRLDAQKHSCHVKRWGTIRIAMRCQVNFQFTPAIGRYSWRIAGPTYQNIPNSQLGWSTSEVKWELDACCIQIGG